MQPIVPVFPCKSLSETLTFYQTLGFEVTYQQKQPYVYAAVTQGEVTLHFSRISQWYSKHAVGLIFVPEVKVCHQHLADALRAKYGKVPTAQLPRITRLRPKQTRFHIFDPSGNVLIYINQHEPETDYTMPESEKSPLAQALENAIFLRDTYVNDEAAAKVLATALARYPSATLLVRALALAAQAEIAVAMGKMALAQTACAELEQINLPETERIRYRDELQAAERLERWLTEPA